MKQPLYQLLSRFVYECDYREHYNGQRVEISTDGQMLDHWAGGFFETGFHLRFVRKVLNASFWNTKQYGINAKPFGWSVLQQSVSPREFMPAG